MSLTWEAVGEKRDDGNQDKHQKHNFCNFWSSFCTAPKPGIATIIPIQKEGRSVVVDRKFTVRELERRASPVIFRITRIRLAVVNPAYAP